VDLDLFISQVMNGISSGVVYASLALALVLIFRATGILNFAQGELALFATYVTWKFTDVGSPVWLAIVASMLLSFAAGMIIERVIIRPVEASSPLVIVIVTIGMFLAVNSFAQLVFGTDEKQLPRAYPLERWSPAGVNISSDVVVLVCVLVAECVLLWVLFQRTKVGMAMRAVASNAESCRLLGVGVGSMLMIGWGLATAIGAVAGALVVPTTPALTAGSLQAVLVFSFAAAALGGFDSPLGAVVGGLIVGVAHALTIQYLDPLDDIELVVPFGIILLVLLFRPNGLFGRATVERV
jgi:branched-chain amino acid transport system permease protein